MSSVDGAAGKPEKWIYREASQCKELYRATGAPATGQVNLREECGGSSQLTASRVLRYG